MGTSLAILISPYTQAVQYFDERVSALSQRVLHLGGDLGIGGADDQSVSLQFFQVLAEGFVSNFFQISLHLIEADRFIFHQTVQDHGFVFSGNQGQGIAVSGLVKVGFFNTSLFHNAYLKVSTLQKCWYWFQLWHYDIITKAGRQ